MERVLETLVLQDYEVVFEVDSVSGVFRKIISKPNAQYHFPDEGLFAEVPNLITIDEIYEADRSIFQSETQHERVLAKMKANEAISIKYRRYSKTGEILYRYLCFVPKKNTSVFICAVRDETNEVHRQNEKNLDLRLKNEGIRFIVENLCENFIIVNVDTHDCTVFTNSEGNIVCKNNFEEQMNWFADNLIVPEDAERCHAYFKIDALIDSIQEAGGVSRITMSVNYKGARHDFAVTSTLIEDPSARQKKSRYIFLCAQDITSIRNAEERNRQLLVSSQFDPLTHLLNRLTTEKQIREHLNTTKNEALNTFMILDIDHFKNVNDEHGHMTGDEVLRHMGNCMREVFRSGDILCRWGGDEFVVFIKGFSDEKVLTNRLNMLRDKMNVFSSRDISLQISLSIGGVCASNKTTLNQLYQKADEALYDVKNHGRNGISFIRLT